VSIIDWYEISAAFGFLVLAAGDVVDPDSAQAPGSQTGGTAVACLLLVAAHVVLLSWPELPPTELHSKAWVGGLVLAWWTGRIEPC
jgi:hypothetical protein